MKWICPIEKRYHNQLKRCQNERYIAEIKTLDWLTYTLYLDDETRVTKFAENDLNEYDKISNPVSGRKTNLQMSEITHRLSSGLIIF